MKLKPTKKHKFKAVPKYIIYEDPADKKTHFLALRNYYTNDSELKRVKENKYNSKYDKFVIYETKPGGMHLIVIIECYQKLKIFLIL